MPYASNKDLPKEVRSALPEAAQTIWRAAYNEALKRNENSEENAARIAWAAVKNKYRQGSDGSWVRKDLTPDELAEMVKLARIPTWLRGKMIDQLAKVEAPPEKTEPEPKKTEKTRSEALEAEVLKQEGKVDLAYRIVKAEDERRFTSGPVYSPDTVDAHGEQVTPEDLQTAMWEYVAKGDRTVRLQHSKERAGEWVELMTWPTAIKTTMTKADGSVDEIEFPAGTVFMGVRWDEDVWPLVKSGRLTGYSMGGRATRVEVEDHSADAA